MDPTPSSGAWMLVLPRDVRSGRLRSDVRPCVTRSRRNSPWKFPGSQRLTCDESPINSWGYGIFGAVLYRPRLRDDKPAHCGRLHGLPGSTRKRFDRRTWFRSREATQDNLTSSARCSARLGSPIAHERRSHPGDSGWTPARILGAGPPAFAFADLNLSLAPTGLPRLTH